MKVNVGEVFEIQRLRRDINGKNLRDINFFYNGEEIKIEEEVYDAFAFTGLSNIDFIEMVIGGKLKNE